jgi:hypothetical protein
MGRDPTPRGRSGPREHAFQLSRRRVSHDRSDGNIPGATTRLGHSPCVYWRTNPPRQCVIVTTTTAALRARQPRHQYRSRDSLPDATPVWSPVGMRKMLIVFLAGVAVFGLADCSSSGSPKVSTTTPTTVRHVGSRAPSHSTGKGLAAYVKCLSQHGVNVQKAAAAKHKGSGGAGAELRKDSHFPKASLTCKHLLTS